MRVAAVARNQSQQMEGIKVMHLPGHHLLVKAPGLVKVPLLVQRQTL